MYFRCAMVYLWKYKNNAHHCGIQIHQHPFRMIQDPPQNPSSHLYFSNRTLEDPTNGPIHMRNLHLSVRFSNTITVFCLTFLANPPEVNQICDILLPYMQFTLHHVSRRHESTNFATCQLPQDNLQYIRECDPGMSEERGSPDRRIRTDRRKYDRQTESRTSEDTDETNNEQQRSQFAVVEDDESTNHR